MLRETVQFILEDSTTCSYFDIAPDLAAADIDSGQIKQVITNLVLNAQQAMPSGGVIYIAAENVAIGPDSTLPLQPGAYVCFSVRDTGVGIPEDILQNIFDPYFTTKTIGSGLGLATAFSIVNNHGGVIDVESKEEEGTTFHVYLPASAEQPRRRRKLRPSSMPMATFWLLRTIASLPRPYLSYWACMAISRMGGRRGLGAMKENGAG